MLYATHMMGWHSDLFKWEKERITLATWSIVFYDLGYKCITGKYSLDNWLNRVEDSVWYSSSSKAIVDNRHKGKTSYTDRLTAEHPRYLHQLWHYATDHLRRHSNIWSDCLANEFKNGYNWALTYNQFKKIQPVSTVKKIRERKKGWRKSLCWQKNTKQASNNMLTG